MVGSLKFAYLFIAHRYCTIGNNYGNCGNNGSIGACLPAWDSLRPVNILRKGMGHKDFVDYLADSCTELCQSGEYRDMWE